MGMILGKLREMVRDWEAWPAVAHGVAQSQTWLDDCTSTTLTLSIPLSPVSLSLKSCDWNESRSSFRLGNPSALGIQSSEGPVNWLHFLEKQKVWGLCVFLLQLLFSRQRSIFSSRDQPRRVLSPVTTSRQQHSEALMPTQPPCPSRGLSSWTSLLVKIVWESLWSVSRSVVSDSLQPCMLCSLRVSLRMGFSRQEYGSGLPFPSPGDFPNPGIKPSSPALADGFFTFEPPGMVHLPRHESWSIYVSNSQTSETRVNTTMGACV